MSFSKHSLYDKTASSRSPFLRYGLSPDLVTITISCSLGNGYCMFGFLIFIIDERNFLYYSLYILTEKSLKHLCSIWAWVPVSFFLFLSLSLQLIPWSTETRLAHSPSRPSKTLSRRHPVPSPLLERAPGALVRDASPVSRTYWFSAETREYQPLLSFTFLCSPPDHQVSVR